MAPTHIFVLIKQLNSRRCVIASRESHVFKNQLSVENIEAKANLLTFVNKRESKCLAL